MRTTLAAIATASAFVATTSALPAEPHLMKLDENGELKTHPMESHIVAADTDVAKEAKRVKDAAPKVRQEKTHEKVAEKKGEKKKTAEKKGKKAAKKTKKDDGEAKPTTLLGDGTAIRSAASHAEAIHHMARVAAQREAQASAMAAAYSGMGMSMGGAYQTFPAMAPSDEAFGAPAMNFMDIGAAPVQTKDVVSTAAPVQAKAVPAQNSAVQATPNTQATAMQAAAVPMYPGVAPVMAAQYMYNPMAASQAAAAQAAIQAGASGALSQNQMSSAMLADPHLMSMTHAAVMQRSGHPGAMPAGMNEYFHAQGVHKAQAVAATNPAAAAAAAASYHAQASAAMAQMNAQMYQAHMMAMQRGRFHAHSLLPTGAPPASPFALMAATHGAAPSIGASALAAPPAKSHIQLDGTKIHGIDAALGMRLQAANAAGLHGKH